MPALGAQATFRSRGDRNAHVGMDSALENRGYALWIACQGKIKTSKAPRTKGPADRGVGQVDGYEIEVNLKRKVFDLWPDLNKTDRAFQESFIQEVYSYLRQSGNAICIKHPGTAGGHGVPVWWLREKWNDVKAVGVFRQTQLTDRERRLSPDEVGENRPPAPVETRRIDRTPAQQAQDERLRQQRLDVLAKAWEKNREKIEREKKERTAQVLDVLRAANWPLYYSEISERAGISRSVAESLVRTLAEEGVLYRRLETREERGGTKYGRFHYLYWHENQIPERPAETYRSTSSLVDKLQDGQTILLSRVTPGLKVEVLEMAEAGLVELFTGEDGLERVRIKPEDTPEAPAPEPEKSQAQPEAEPAALLGVVTPPEGPDYPGALRALADNVERALAQRGPDVDALKAEHARELDQAHQRRKSVEDALIQARAELSERTHERDELQSKLDTIRASLGL